MSSYGSASYSNNISSMNNVASGTATSGDQMARSSAMYDLGEKLSSYENKDIREQIQKMRELRKKVTWEGSDADVSLQGYDEFVNEMEKLAQGVDRYGEFLKHASDEYKQTRTAIKNEFNDIYHKEVA